MWAPQLVTSRDEIADVYNFLNRPEFVLNYPGFSDWLQKAREETLAGIKKSYIVRNESGVVIGASVFQQHKSDSHLIELKTRRVDPQLSRKGIGLALVGAMESYALAHNYKGLIVDTHAQNTVSLGSLQKAGFVEIARENLYSRDISEVVLLKNL